MTPSQLEHLKLIDAHLERLLANAKKRTAGEWTAESEDGSWFVYVNSSNTGVTCELNK